MKIHRKYFEFSLFLIVVLSITIFAYSKMFEDQSSKTVNASIEKKTTSTNPEIKETSLIIETATATQEEQMISIDLKIKNKNESAQVLKPELFSLISNTTVLSPKEKSDIPKQIPAQTEAEFKLIFDVKNMEGTVPIKLGFQAIGSSKPQQFYPLGNLNIKRNVSTPSTASKPNSTTMKTSKAPSSPQTEPNTEIILHSQSIGPIQVLVPDGWIKSPHKGGDFGGFQFMNPKDRNQQMLVVYSACAGCGYLKGDTSQKPDPVSLIPETPLDSFVFNKGLAAGYSYKVNGNPYTGNGVVKMKRLKGYSFVEIMLPDSKKTTAAKILNSFKFNGVH